MKERTIVNKMNRYIPSVSAGYIKLDANESSINMTLNLEQKYYNRYPDSDAIDLKKAIATYLSMDSENIVVGNGSSEMIELLLKTYLNPGETVMSFEPSFVMYKQFTELYNGRYVGVKTKDYVMDVDVMIDAVKREQPQMLFICNPNNPTGYLMSKIDIERLLKNVKCLVVVDEAYVEFAGASMLNRLDQYKNLVVLRTFSKAWGLAAARLGYMVASEDITCKVNTVKSPYNLNLLSQQLGIAVIKQSAEILAYIKTIIFERERVFKALINFDIKAYKSFGNFIFFEGCDDIYDALKNRGILIRTFKNGTYRVTIGSKEENTKFLEEMIVVLKIRDEVIYETNCTG